MCFIYPMLEFYNFNGFKVFNRIKKYYALQINKVLMKNTKKIIFLKEGIGLLFWIPEWKSPFTIWKSHSLVAKSRNLEGWKSMKEGIHPSNPCIRPDSLKKFQGLPTLNGNPGYLENLPRRSRKSVGWDEIKKKTYKILHNTPRGRISSFTSQHLQKEFRCPS